MFSVVFDSVCPGGFKRLPYVLFSLIGIAMFPCWPEREEMKEKFERHVATITPNTQSHRRGNLFKLSKTFFTGPTKVELDLQFWRVNVSFLTINVVR